MPRSGRRYTIRRLSKTSANVCMTTAWRAAMPATLARRPGAGSAGIGLRRLHELPGTALSDGAQTCYTRWRVTSETPSSVGVGSVASGDPIVVPLGFGGRLVEATFLARPNRFLVDAQIGSMVVQAHLADRGRLKDTLVPGAQLLLAHRDGAGRKTQYQAVAALRSPEPIGHIQHGDLAHTERVATQTLVSLDTHLPNRLILAALRAGALARFAGYACVRPEVTVGRSRFDFLLENPDERCVLEVKSAADVQDGEALFPDAPTTRGVRHLEELAALVATGARVAVLFVAQGDARAVTMNRLIDPLFATTLGRVAAAGVEVCAVTCRLDRDGLTLGAEIPVLLHS